MTTTLNASTAGAGGFIATGDNSGSLALQTAGTTAVTIDTSQNVGINQTSPTVISTAKQLAIKAPVNGDALFVSQNSNGLTTFIAGYYGVTAGPDKPVIGSYSNDPVAFLTNNTERMRIDSSGRLFIGRTSASAGNGTLAISNASAATGCIDLTMKNGGTNYMTNTSGTANYIAWEFDNNGGSYTTCGTILVGGTTTSYNTSSDYRLKENVQPMTGALAKVTLLKPVTYKWKSNGTDGEGFIAHELAEVCPQAVSGEKDALKENGSIMPQGVDTSFLVATLTAAIQELKAINDTQAATINALTARVVALESRGIV